MRALCLWKKQNARRRHSAARPKVDGTPRFFRETPERERAQPCRQAAGPVFARRRYRKRRLFRRQDMTSCAQGIFRLKRFAFCLFQRQKALDRMGERGRLQREGTQEGPPRAGKDARRQCGQEASQKGGKTPQGRKEENAHISSAGQHACGKTGRSVVNAGSAGQGQGQGPYSRTA